MHEWIYPESAQKLKCDEIERLKIFKTPKKPLYHYTSREVFWLIMEGESFLARHIMFSNDYKENMIGREKINRAVTDSGENLQETETSPFMICFCEEGDLLSQWRGYANEGVAIEFDFSKGLGLSGLKEGFSSYHCYTIMDNKNSDSTVSMNDIAAAIVSPYSVIYVKEGVGVDDIIEQKLSRIKKNPEENRQQYIVGMIPYIKNDKFTEEKEYRLIFDMKQIISDKQQDLLSKKYVYLDVNGIKKPNIRVRFGVQSHMEEETIKLYYSNDKLKGILKELKQDLEADKIKTKLVMNKKKFKMSSDEIIISDGKSQEQVCLRLRLKLRQQILPIRNVKVWCDGHLPVRRVIVGPSQDAELMKCSIEEYLKTKYWMRDIKVDISKIPLRT